MPDLLHYVELTCKRSLEFVAAFAGEAKLPSLAEALTDLDLQRDMAGPSPLIGPFEASLGTMLGERDMHPGATNLQR